MKATVLLFLAVQAYALLEHPAHGANTIALRSDSPLDQAIVEFGTHSLVKKQVRTKCASGVDSWGKCVAKDRMVVGMRSSNNDTDDVSAEFEQAIRAANNGGLLKLEKGKTYVIGKVLDLVWLNDVYIQIEGTIKFTDDIEYWQKNAMTHPFQKSIAFWRWGGTNIKIFGGGTIDGSGQKWWNEFANNKKDILDKDNTFYRPILFYAANATRMDITNINFHDSPAWFTFFVDSKDIIIDRSTFVAHSTGSRPKNSDGFDSYNVDGVRITNCMMDVDDDCISPKANTTNLLVENVHCKGSHGISMGSIGQYPGTLDYITNVRIANVTLVDGTIGVRLKAWAGENVGYGYMRNITYQDINVENVDEPIVLDQCYFNVKDADCQKFPSKVDLEDIHFINITGSSSGKKGNVVGTMRCSPEAECKNIELKNIDLKNGANETDKPIIKCDGIKGMAPGSCVETQPKTGGKPTSKPATKTDKSGQEKSFFANQGLLYVLLPFGMWLALFW